MDAVAPPLGMSLRRLEAQLSHGSRIGGGFVSETFDLFSVREEEGLAEGTQKGRCYPRSYRGRGRVRHIFPPRLRRRFTLSFTESSLYGQSLYNM